LPAVARLNNAGEIGRSDIADPKVQNRHSLIGWPQKSQSEDQLLRRQGLNQLKRRCCCAHTGCKGGNVFSLAYTA